MMAGKTIISDEEIVKLVILRDRAGAEALYDRYASALFLAIIRIIPQKDKAENILEQTFTKIWNSFDLYAPQKEKLFTWMFMIARSMAKTAIDA